MKAARILVPTDFSPGAQAALDCATELAKSLHARLHIVHVELSPVLAAPYDDEDNAELQRARFQLELAQPTSPAVAFDTVLLQGNTAAALINYAKESGADMIVMGTHGQTNAPGAVMGSVAQAVSQGVPCICITVKPV